MGDRAKELERSDLLTYLDNLKGQCHGLLVKIWKATEICVPMAS